MSNKSYSPFRMWGSWIGAILYVVFGIPMGIGLADKIPFSEVLFFPLWLLQPIVNLSKCSGEGCWGISILTGLIILLISGFLIGWGIHSLIRRYT